MAAILSGGGGGGELMETCIWLCQLIELMESVVAYHVVEIA